MIEIRIADLAANSIIFLFENFRVREITFKQLYRFGLEVEKKIEEKTGREAYFIYDKYSTSFFMNNYSDFFDVIDNEKERKIVLRNDKNVEDLRGIFINYFTAEIINAYRMAWEIFKQNELQGLELYSNERKSI